KLQPPNYVQFETEPADAAGIESILSLHVTEPLAVASGLKFDRFLNRSNYPLATASGSVSTTQLLYSIQKFIRDQIQIRRGLDLLRIAVQFFEWLKRQQRPDYPRIEFQAGPFN